MFLPRKFNEETTEEYQNCYSFDIGADIMTTKIKKNTLKEMEGLF